MFPAWTTVRFPNDTVMAPPAYVRQVRNWALEAFTGKPGEDGSARVRLRVLRQDHSTLHFGRSAIETPLRIGSRSFQRGLGTHAFSDIAVSVPEGAVRFEAAVGVDNNADTGGRRGSVEFVVLVDGEEVARTPVLKAGDPPVPIVLRVPVGARELRLQVTDGGDGVAFDQADWADAAFVMADRSTRYLDEGQLDLPMAGTEVTFSFVLGGQSSRDLLDSWARETQVADTSDSSRIRTVWREPRPGLVVTLEARAFKRYPAVEWVLYFENQGAVDTPILEKVRALDLRFASGFARLPVTLHHLNGDTCSETSFEPRSTTLEAGKPIHWAPTGGRPSSMTAFPFWNMQYTDRGIIVGLGWTGQWCADFARLPEGPSKIEAGMEVLRTVLHPGERIRTPRVLMMPWQGDRTMAHVRFRRLMMEYFTPHMSGKVAVPPLAIQSFDRYHSRDGWATEAGQLVYVRTAADLGFDSVWLDAAWFPGGFPNGVGSWYAEPNKFPRGLRPIADAAHERKLRFILWFEPERVAPGSQIAAEHPEWVFGGPNGGLFKLNDPQARKWLTDLLIQRIREYGVDVYRNDFNIDPLPFWQAADTENRQGMTEIRYVEGLYEMWDAILRECAGVQIDNCASGGRRLDLEMMMRSVPLWRSDTGCWAGHPEWNQMQTMALAEYLPLFTVGLWSPDPYERRSAATAGVPCEVPYLDEGYDATSWKLAVSEISALREYWFGDFYPIARADVAADGVAGWQLHRPDLDAGVIYCFRRSESALAGVVVVPRGVKARNRYVVMQLGEDGRSVTRSLTGKELLDGVVIRWPKGRSSIVVHYKAASAGAPPSRPGAVKKL